MECIWGMFCWGDLYEFGSWKDVHRGFCGIIDREVNVLGGGWVQYVIVNDIGDFGGLLLE